MLDKIRAPHYTVVEDAVIDDMRLSANALLVYVALRRHVNADGECWPSWARIGTRARLRRTSVSAAIGELERLGYLKREPRVGGTNVYTLLIPVRVADAPVREADYPPVRVADAEVSSEISNPNEEHTVAIAPVRRSRNGKHSAEEVAFHRELGDIMVAKGDHWKNGVAEAKTLYDLIKWFRLQAPDAWTDFGRNVVAMFWELKQGTAPGQAFVDWGFWSKQPFTPCGLSSLCTRVSQYLRVDLEAEEQLKGWG